MEYDKKIKFALQINDKLKRVPIIAKHYSTPECTEWDNLQVRKIIIEGDNVYLVGRDASSPSYKRYCRIEDVIAVYKQVDNYELITLFEVER